jgi:putative ABC transport system permease protein
MDPYALVPSITKVIRSLASDQPVERAATLEDVRAEVLSPNRINALVFSGFAGVALAIAIVGVAGVLAFSVCGRTREFGIRLAVGSTPSAMLARILEERRLDWRQRDRHARSRRASATRRMPHEQPLILCRTP